MFEAEAGALDLQIKHLMVLTILVGIVDTVLGLES